MIILLALLQFNLRKTPLTKELVSPGAHCFIAKFIYPELLYLKVYTYCAFSLRIPPAFS